MIRRKLLTLSALVMSLTVSLSGGTTPTCQVRAGYVLPGGDGALPADMGPGPDVPPVRPASQATPTSGWHQEAHDAQHTGYSPEEVSLPWTFQWQWNGSCANGSDCRPGDPERGWTFEVPPRSHLVAGDGRLYLPAGEHGVWAINEADGRTAWHNGAIESYCTAAFDPETHTLFVAASDRRLYRLDSSTGTVIGSYQADSGLNLAPTIAGDRVYVVSDSGTLYAVNKSTMSRIWSYSAGSPGQTSVAYSARYDVLVFGAEDLTIHAVNNSSGLRRWRRKPTTHSPGGLSYHGSLVEGSRMYRTYNYEHGWPVVAEDHGVVFVRLRLPRAAAWTVPPGGPNWFPSSNGAIRDFLVNHPDLQTLFALNLDDGSTAFIPAVGAGGDETPVEKDISLGTLPVVRRVAGGHEVAYVIWRNGQKCEAGDCSDPRWDAVMGEMVLDGSTVPGYQAGDCRFVDWKGNGNLLFTDEMRSLSVAGDTIFHSHALALQAFEIIDRGSSRGGTYLHPILTESQGYIVSRASDEPDWVTCRPNADHFCGAWVDTYCDRRVYKNAFWVFFNYYDPPLTCGCTGCDCVAPGTFGYSPGFTVINDGRIYFMLNGGAIFAVGSDGGSVRPPVNYDNQFYFPLVARSH